MIDKFNQTAVVIVEVTEKGKRPELKYVTIGNIGKNATEAEFAKDALDYIKCDGTMEVKEVVFADSEKYRTFIEDSMLNR